MTDKRIKTIDDFVLAIPEAVDVELLRKNALALIYTESERAAAMVRQRGDERNLIGTGIIADELLTTSPGKEGGR